jgi:hypothetical protein
MPKNVSAKQPQNAPSPKDNNVYYANSICMNRNRDLNGNGVIDDNELRWYLPTSATYMQIAVAQSELPDPIMRFTEYDKWYFINLPGNNGDRYGTYNFHYITSDYQYYWAEQSVNTGDDPYSGYSPGVSVANTARCVRNLGTKPSTVPQKGVTEVGHAYKHDEKTHTFEQVNFTDETLRGYNEGGIAPHNSASPSARPYKKFEYATSIVKNISDNYVSFDGNGNMTYNSVANWTNSLMHNTICGKYYQEADKSDRGTWRVPTDCEVALMWIEGIMQTNGGHGICATQDYFVYYDFRNNATNNQTYLGYNDDWNRKVLAIDITNKSVRVRCVRDVR